jgi:uncharacterized membrane protein
LHVPPGIGEELVLWAIAGAVGAACAALAALRAKTRVKSPTPETVVWAFTAAYFVTFSALTLARHYGMSTYGLDLGYYANTIYQFGRGRFFQQSLLTNEIFVNHCAPLLAVFAPFTYVFRDPAYLLPLQTLFIAAGIPLVYFIARPENGSRWPAAALAVSFALSPALHGANLYDFHPRSLGVPLALGAFFFFRRKNLAAGLACTGLLALAQDELAVHAVALALYGGYAVGRRRAGLVAAGVLAAYFVGFCSLLYPALTYGPTGKTLHFLDYFAKGTSTGGTYPFAPATLAAKGAYVGALVLPIASLLPAAGAALVTVATPLAVPALANRGTVFEIGWQYPLAILPFLYGAAAVALRRLVRADASRRRRFFVTAASVLGVVLQILLVIAMSRGMYSSKIPGAFPSDYEKALAGAASRAPRDVPFYADDVFAARLAHRRHLYLYYPAPGVWPPVEPEGMLLERRVHPPLEFAVISHSAAKLNLTPVEISGDYAYFERRPGDHDAEYERLFRAWYGTLEEWQCWAPGGKRAVRDPRALNGRAVRFENYLNCDPGRTYVYPPGDYRLAFLLRPVDAGVFNHAVLTVRVISYADSSSYKAYRKIKPFDNAEDYRPCVIPFKSREPFTLQLEVHSVSPLYLDAISVNSDDYTLANVRALGIKWRGIGATY